MGRGGTADVDGLRLVTKVARLYHVRGMRQVEIASRLHLSQPRVSRLLAQGEELGIVRNLVAVPVELNHDLEEGLRHAYGLRDAHVVDAVAGDDQELATDLGIAASPFLASAFDAHDVRTIGFMPWSRTLRSAVEVMRPMRPSARRVVEMLGDLGAPTLQQEVAHLTQRLSSLVGADPAFLRVPGVVADPAVAQALLVGDPHARETVRLLNRLGLQCENRGQTPLDVLRALVGEGVRHPGPQELEEMLRDLRDDMRDIESGGIAGFPSEEPAQPWH